MTGYFISPMIQKVVFLRLSFRELGHPLKELNPDLGNDFGPSSCLPRPFFFLGLNFIPLSSESRN